MMVIYQTLDCFSIFKSELKFTRNTRNRGVVCWWQIKTCLFEDLDIHHVLRVNCNRYLCTFC